MLCHAKVTPQDGALGVDGKSTSKVIFGNVVLLLPEVNGAEAVPGVIMPLIGAERVAIAGRGLLKVFVCDVFVTRQGVRVGE